MSDKKTDFETDFEEKWAEIASKKSRSRTNNNIYERFISRVQSDEADEGDDNETDDVKPLENAKQSSASSASAFEPLSVSELGLFYGHDEKAVVTATEATVDFLAQETQVNTDLSDTNLSWQDRHSNDSLLDIESDDNDMAPTDNATGLAETKETAHIPSDTGVVSQKPPIQSATQLAVKQSTPSQNKLVSSKKPLIIGMIVGSLLIVIIVVTLIFTGVLSTATQTVAEPASPVITSTAPPTSTIDSPISTDASATDNLAVEAQQSDNSSANQDQNAVTNNAVVAEMPKNAPTAADNSNTDMAITYEDFRQESQNTLYRETDD